MQTDRAMAAIIQQPPSGVYIDVCVKLLFVEHEGQIQGEIR